MIILLLVNYDILHYLETVIKLLDFLNADILSKICNLSAYNKSLV